MRYGRLILGALLIAGALWIIVGEQMTGASADATLNAPLVTVRAPVAGTVGLPPRSLGARVAAGETVATLRDALVDGVRLDDLEMERGFAAAQIARLTALIGETDAIIAALEDRAGRYRALRTEELALRLSFARERLAALQGWLDAGAAAPPPLATGPEALPVAPAGPEGNLPELWLAEARERVETLEVALRAAEAGVFLGDGYNDAPNAEQRRVELASERAALQAQLAEAKARQAALLARLAAERRRVNLFGGAEMAAPVAGQLWEVLAANGETVQRGDPVARLLDCGGIVVTASVTEAVYNRLTLGSPAVFRPRGSAETFEGTVIRLAGAGAATIYRNLAVAPSQRHLERHDVTVLVPGLVGHAELDCAIGRTGRVFFEPRPLDRLRALLR